MEVNLKKNYVENLSTSGSRLKKAKKKAANLHQLLLYIGDYINIMERHLEISWPSNFSTNYLHQWLATFLCYGLGVIQDSFSAGMWVVLVSVCHTHKNKQN